MDGFILFWVVFCDSSISMLGNESNVCVLWVSVLTETMFAYLHHICIYYLYYIHFTCLTSVLWFQQFFLRPNISCLFFKLQNKKEYVKKQKKTQTSNNLPPKKSLRNFKPLQKNTQTAVVSVLHIPSGKGSHSDCWNSPMFKGKYIFNPGPFSIATVDRRNPAPVHR